MQITVNIGTPSSCGAITRTDVVTESNAKASLVPCDNNNVRCGICIDVSEF